MLVVEREIHGRKFSFESGRIARQANGAVLVRSGESVVLVTATMGGERDVDFLPLSIDYVEKTYAAGKIPGGFLKREGRLSEPEILTSRFIDRPCRPLFPKGFNREIQLVATVLSADVEAETDVMALSGASAALSVSDIPFEGPVAGLRVARVNGELCINPSMEKARNADINFIVAGSQDAIVMVEGGASQVPEQEVLDALFYAHQELQVMLEMQKELQEKIGKEKFEFTPPERDAKIIAAVEKKAAPQITKAVRIKDKMERRDALRAIKDDLKEEFIKEGSDDAEEISKIISAVFEDQTYTIVRGMAFDKSERIDGRDFKTVRPIDIDVSFLPRAHGSAVFTRGETQAIVAATLGVGQEAQIIDSLYGEDRNWFMLHYNFPPFSVGEVKMLRGPGRREYGHGALARRALETVLPKREDFPYVLRVVSEITESNGSSSMATVCGTSLSLMDAGVPIKAPVAGVAMGLMKDGDKCCILTDILGDEDHLGDMDFKVCGTAEGITALQMDIKIKGLDPQIMSDALSQARDARLHILEKMTEVIAEPRDDLSNHAPRITTLKVSPDRIKDIIGPGGKTIRSIVESHQVKIDVADDGVVTISGTDRDQLKGAIAICESLTAEAKIGEVYKGLVKRIADFGAFVEILPGVDGLVHISQLAEEKVRRVEDVVQEGDEVYVRVLDIDRQGKIRLSRKDALDHQAGESA